MAATPEAVPEREPVTVVVTRRVRSGAEAAYEAWLERLIADARALDGFLGARVQRPGAGEPRVYTSIFRFDTVEHLRAFEDSDLRRRALQAVAELVEVFLMTYVLMPRLTRWLARWIYPPTPRR